MLELLENEGVVNLILGGIALIIGAVAKMEWSKRHDLDLVWAALQTGVNETYRGYVKALKAGREDGKLEDFEKEAARKRAVDIAKDILADQGVRLCKYYGPRIAQAIVSRMADRSKTVGKIAGPLAGLSLDPELDF